MDWLVYGCLIVAVVMAGAALYGGDVIAWLRAEYRAARQETFAPGTMKDPRTHRLYTKQRALSRRMRKEGRSLLNREKWYEPELTKPQPAPAPPKAAEVVPIRKRA